MGKKIKENIPGWKLNKLSEGSVFRSNNFGMFEVINYVSNKEVYIKFIDTDCVVKVSYQAVRKGAVTDYMARKVYGVGYLGAPKVKKEDYKIYRRWIAVLERCYYHDLLSYKGVTVCEEWHNLQNFILWCKENGFSEKYELDKDLLVKGNKIYSPQTCCFIPNEINQFLVKSKSRRGKYKIGVTWDTTINKYKASCQNKGVLKSLGNYDKELDAFMAYKTYKEKLAKEYAYKYDGILSSQVIHALLNFTVDEND